MNEPMSALSRFAHLAGLNRAPKPKATQTPAEIEAAAKAAGKKAEDDAAKKKGDGEEGDDDGEGDDDEDEDENEEAKKAAAVIASASAKAERERCAAIFSSPEAEGRVALAASLAFETDLSAEQAVAIMKSTPKGQAAKGDRFDQLMQSVRNPQVGGEQGGDEAMTDAAKLIASATAAYDQALGKKK